VRFDEKAAQEHPRSLVQVVLKAHEAALPVWQSPQTAPHFNVAPYNILLLFSELDLVPSDCLTPRRSMHQNR
jgi:hypothetical protein